ncbi:MAG: hypothetical protein ACI4MS_04850 [Candidatus Coproplasma sp.]
MAEGYIDLSPIIRAIDTVNSNLRVVSNQVSSVENRVEAVRRETMQEIDNVKRQLVEMLRQQKMQSALQIATTEVIRVRQELQKQFGTHQLVRDNMLGILQATDLGLITESTISRCTEELMLSAPNYWLAPGLIALAAWISNNESLAKRAIAEACKRDREKTCLLFALITRRVNAGRIQAGKQPTDTTFEWLGEYFKLQDPSRMRTSIIAYIDAYTNHIFGEDKENICGEHIYHWMEVLKERDPEFADKQVKYWENMFSTYVNSGCMNDYQDLQKVCVQYNSMQEYLIRIDATQRETGIKAKFGDMMGATVDTVKLVKDIDEQLVRLVSNYEEDEEKLREEEHRFQKIKDFKGDEERADRIIRAEKARLYDAPVDFAKRLANSVFDPNASASAKKSALVLLRPYISSAFNSFIVEKKDAYPEEIDLVMKVPGKDVKSSIVSGVTVAKYNNIAWNGKTANAENREELVASIQKKFKDAENSAYASISDAEINKALKNRKLSFCFSILIIPIFMGFHFNKKAKQLKAENEKARADIKAYYAKASKESVAIINKALDERVKANEIVAQFGANEKNETIEI